MLGLRQHGGGPASAAELVGFIPGQHLNALAGEMEQIFIQRFVQGAQRAEGHPFRLRGFFQDLCGIAGELFERPQIQGS
ncbi:hypothetical protein D3C73_1039690 [compost metagenome]